MQADRDNIVPVRTLWSSTILLAPVFFLLVLKELQLNNISIKTP